MKFLLSVAAVIAVAVAGPTQRGLITPGAAGSAPVMAPEPVAIGPAVIDFTPIAVGPAIIDAFEPISVGPAIIDFEPVAIGPALVDMPEVAPTPVIVAEEAVADAAVADAAVAASAPMVQIILNINTAASESGPIVATPVIVGDFAPQPTPVHVVESAAEPVNVVEVVPLPVGVVEVAPEPVQVVEVAPTPVQVIEAAPVPAEPVIIGTPILPSPAVVLPEELN